MGQGRYQGVSVKICTGNRVIAAVELHGVPLHSRNFCHQAWQVGGDAPRKEA